MVQALANRALAHMEQKYHAPFDVVLYKDGGFVTRDVKLRVLKKGDVSQNTANVYYSAQEDGFTDNYFGIQVLDEYTQWVRGIVEKELPDCRVFCSGFMEGFFDDCLDGDKTLNEAQTIGQSLTGRLFIYAEAEEKDARKMAYLLKDLLPSEGIDALVRFISLKPGQLQHVNEENFTDVLPFIKDKEQQICTYILDFFTGGDSDEFQESEV